MITAIRFAGVALLVGLLSCTTKPERETAHQSPFPATEPTAGDPVAESPAAVVQGLYGADKAGEGPYTTNNSATIARYFNRDLTDLIWQDRQTTQKTGEVSMIAMDPLYHAQDTDIRNFRIAPPTYPAPNRTAEIIVTFTNLGTAETLRYQLTKEPAGWRIGDIIYRDGSQLLQMLSGRSENTP